MIVNFIETLEAMWAFKTLTKNYRYSKNIDDVIDRLIQEEPVSITRGGYEVTIETDNLTFTAWDANIYYAWLQSGTFSNRKTNKKYKWSNSMPSFRHMLILYDYIQKFDTNEMEGVLE